MAGEGQDGIPARRQRGGIMTRGDHGDSAFFSDTDYGDTDYADYGGLR
jgi:hypothetical protein